MTKLDRKIVVRATTPLGLLTLAACGGGGGGGLSSGGSSVSTPQASAFNGAVVNSPLTGARVFLDLADAQGNFNGVLDAGELSTISGANGAFTFSAEQMSGLTGETYRIVATTDDSVTVTNSEGQTVENISLVASSDSSVVTPLTTLLEAQEIDIEDFKEVMGLDFDPRTFNPYEDATDPNALAAATKAKQVMTVLESVASTAAAAGGDPDKAFSSAVEAFVDVVAQKVADGETLSVDGSNALDGSNDVANLIESGLAKAEAQDANVDATVIEALEADVKQAAVNVASEITRVASDSEATLASSQATFKAVAVLKEQLSDVATDVKAAVDAAGTDETARANAATTAKTANTALTFKSAELVQDTLNELGSNLAPTAVVFKLTSSRDSNPLSETKADSVTVGKLVVTDFNAAVGDADPEPDTGGHTFKIVNDEETDFDKFSIDENTGILTLNGGVDFESIEQPDGSAVLTLKVKVTDQFSEAYTQTLKVLISDVNERPKFEDITETLLVNEVKTTQDIQLTVVDPEEDTVAYSSETGTKDGDVLTITGTYGTLAVSADGSAVYTLDETGSAYVALEDDEQKIETFEIVATESLTEQKYSTSITVNIEITGADDAPLVPSVSMAPLSVDENDDSGVLLGVFASTDPDGSDVVLSLKDNPTSKLRFDASTNELSLVEAWDLETDGDEIKFTMVATSNGVSTSKAFSLPVNDKNDAPNFINPTNGNTTKEVIPLRAVEDTPAIYTFDSSTIGITDPDALDTFDTLKFELVSVADGVENDAPDWVSLKRDDENDTLTIRAAAVEGDQSVDLQLTAKDSTGASSSITIDVDVVPVDDQPVLTLSSAQASSSIGAGDSGATAVADLAAVDEEDDTADLSYFIVTSDETDPVISDELFIVDGNRVKIRSDVDTSEFSGREVPLTLVAKDSFGNYSEPVTVDVTFIAANAPEILSFSASTTSGSEVVGSGQIIISAIASKNVESGSTFDVVLQYSDSETETVTLTRDSVDPTLFTHTLTIDNNSTNTDNLLITRIQSPSVVDSNDLAMVEASVDPEIGSLNVAIDTVAPTASVSQQTESLPFYTIAEDGTSSLTLTINSADTLGLQSDVDIKTDLDFTKLSWAINGNDSNSFKFATDSTSYVKSATLSEDTSGNDILTIVLSKQGKSTLEGLTGFGGSNDTLDVEAGFLLDAAGNASASTRTDVTIEMAETESPVISSITAALADTNGNTYADDTEVVTFTATLDTPIKSGTSFDVTLASGDTITFTSTDSASATITSDVRMTSTFSDFAKGGLAIDSYTIDSASDVYGNLVADDTSEDSFDNLAAATFGRDTADPTSSVNQQTDFLPLYTINEDGSSTLRLTINDADEMGFSDGDVKEDATDALDFTKLFWSINGVDSNSFQFETSTITDYVASAEMSVTDTTGTLDITLSAKGREALEGLTGFGGSNDTLDVEAGFLLDAAGNASASTRTDVTIEMAETESPVISSITAALADTNGNTYADDTEVVTFTATLDTPIKSGTSFDVTLASGDTITFTSTDSASTTITSDVRMTSTFSDFAKGGLAIDSYTIDSASDVYGNLVADDTSVDDFDGLAAATFGRDTADPTSSVNQQTDFLPLYTINEDGSSTLRLTINDADEMGFSDGDVKVDATGALDFTKLFWSINGVDSNSFQFETSTITDYVASAEMSVSDTTGTLDITLSAKGRTALEGLTGFGGSNDTLDVEAGFLLDAAGNASASTRTDVTIEMAETESPAITSITATLADTNGNTYADDTEIVTFTATLDKPIKSGTTFDVTLASGDTITFTSTDSASATITSDVRMTSTFSDFAKGGLAIDSYTIDSASDVYGNLVADDTALDSFDNLAAATFGRDTADPTSSVNQQTGSLPLYTINEDGSSTLRLTINDADEMGFSDGDVKVDATGALDFTKLFWSINGQDTNSLRFETSTITDYVASAEMSVSDTTGTLDITLSAKGRTALEGLTGFGGSNDTLDVEAGFLLDAAGNASASTRTDVTIEMADTQAPEVTDITAALADNESYGIGDKINFTVTLDKAVKAGSEISLNIKTGLGSDGNNTTLAEFVTVTTEAESTILTGIYDIQANDDSTGLEVLSYSVEEGSVDPYGNAIAEDTPVESIDTILPFSVDATSPTAAPARIWNNTADELKIVFNEELTEASEADIQAAILDVLTGSTAEDVTWNNNEDGDSLFTVTLNGETLSGTVNDDGQEVSTVVFELGLTLEDLAGNTTEIDSLEFTIL